MAILEGDVGPRQFRPDLLADERIKVLAEKIMLQADEALDQFVSGGVVSIFLKDGRSLQTSVD
jgi:2-methylcitrate dehydratase PrpD